MAEGEAHQSWEAMGVRRYVHMNAESPHDGIRNWNGERERDLEVKEQKETNQWKKYCDYRRGSHWNSDWRREG